MDRPVQQAEEVTVLTPRRIAMRCWYALHLLVADDANELVVSRRPPHGYALVPSPAGDQAEDDDSTQSEYALEPRRLQGCRCTFCRLG